MAGRLLEFGEELRGEGVAVGTSELLDAFEVLREVPWTALADFREGLAATLAKSQEDRRVFDLVFDRFFFRATELAAVREGVTESGGIDAAGAELNLETLRQEIARALLLLGADDIDNEVFVQTMSVIVKHRTDLDVVAERVGMKLPVRAAPAGQP